MFILCSCRVYRKNYIIEKNNNKSNCCEFLVYPIKIKMESIYFLSSFPNTVIKVELENISNNSVEININDPIIYSKFFKHEYIKSRSQHENLFIMNQDEKKEIYFEFVDYNSNCDMSSKQFKNDTLTFKINDIKVNNKSMIVPEVKIVSR